MDRFVKLFSQTPFLSPFIRSTWFIFAFPQHCFYLYLKWTMPALVTSNKCSRGLNCIFPHYNRMSHLEDHGISNLSSFPLGQGICQFFYKPV